METRLSDNAFQILAAATCKARLPTVKSLKDGTTRRLVPEERQLSFVRSSQHVGKLCWFSYRRTNSLEHTTRCFAIDPAVHCEHFRRDSRTHLFTGHYGLWGVLRYRALQFILLYKYITWTDFSYSERQQTKQNVAGLIILIREDKILTTLMSCIRARLKPTLMTSVRLRTGRISGL